MTWPKLANGFGRHAGTVSSMADTQTGPLERKMPKEDTAWSPSMGYGTSMNTDEAKLTSANMYLFL